MRISKHTREQAIWLLSIGASTPDAPWDAWDAIGVSEYGPTSDLMGAVMASTLDEVRGAVDWRVAYAEAEAKLRTGWNPGECE